MWLFSGAKELVSGAVWNGSSTSKRWRHGPSLVAGCPSSRRWLHVDGQCLATSAHRCRRHPRRHGYRHGHVIHVPSLGRCWLSLSRLHSNSRVPHPRLTSAADRRHSRLTCSYIRRTRSTYLVVCRRATGRKETSDVGVQLQRRSV